MGISLMSHLEPEEKKTGKDNEIRHYSKGNRKEGIGFCRVTRIGGQGETKGDTNRNISPTPEFCQAGKRKQTKGYGVDRSLTFRRDLYWPPLYVVKAA